MSARLLAVVPLALLAACNADPDGDGLSNGEEKDLGLDKKIADTDGDGLDDGAEVEAGANPLVQDTDGDGLLDGAEVENGADPTVTDTDEDGYTDFDEVNEGHDPADDRDRIYKGRWPYYADKDSISGGGMNNTVEVGKRFGRAKAKDQFGDTVDLFDFYNSDKPVVVDISAEWCGPCNSLAAWLDGEPDAYYDQFWAGAPDAIKNGDIYWVTVIGQDIYGQPADKATATRWYDAYPSKQIPVLADDDSSIVDHAGLQWWPYTLLLTPELKLDEAGSDGSAETVLMELATRFE